MSDRGTYRRYAEKRLSDEKVAQLAQANRIMDEYEAQGLVMTLRQLYYQLVARGLLENTVKNYDRLGDLISDGRVCGLVSWTAIEDRGRNLKGVGYSDDPAASLRGLAEGYRVDKWADQPNRVEVWIEKEALEGVVAGICRELEVDYFACKGYNSQSEQWRAGRRFADYVRRGQSPVVLHLGDHDPSGLDMTRDNRERLSLFAGVPINVVRIALNMRQVEELRPPPNPAKPSDARYADYARTYGEECWELDALNPAYLRRLVSDAVLAFRDGARWDASLEAEAAEREVLTEIAESFAERGGPEEGDA